MKSQDIIPFSFEVFRGTSFPLQKLQCAGAFYEHCLKREALKRKIEALLDSTLVSKPHRV